MPINCRDQQSATNIKLNQLLSASQELQYKNVQQLKDLKEDLSRFVIQSQERQEVSRSNNSSAAQAFPSKLQDLLNALPSKASTIRKENIILKSLYFPSMNDRQSSIELPAEGTFNWILEEDPSHEFHMDDEFEFMWLDESLETPSSAQALHRSRARSAFRTWLETDNGLFHVSGKAGCGKSCLMNTLSTHRQTNQGLQIWSGDKELIFAKFFFWKSGDKLQRSLQGLYRSILFEVLRNCTQLISGVFPHEWEALQHRDAPVEGVILSEKAIEKAFYSLATAENLAQYRLCFFIDRLDEYDGDSVDHVRLAESLLQWASSADVKICASSRPYNEFIHVFPESKARRFHLHELTQRDIYLFTRQSIEEDRNFKCIENNYLRLVNQIVEMSEGVFLWARLVVRSLSDGTLRHDSISALEAKLHRTPKDLNQLYRQLFESMDPYDRMTATKMLLVATHAPRKRPLHAAMFAWINDLDKPHFPPLDGIKPSSWPRPRDMVTKVERQLASITKGLLHVVHTKEMPGGDRDDEFVDVFDYHSRPTVQFLHRSVGDYVLETVAEDSLSAPLRTVISTEAYTRLWIAEMTLLGSFYSVCQWNENRFYYLEGGMWEILPIHLIDALHLLMDTNYQRKCVNAQCDWNLCTFRGNFEHSGIEAQSALSFLHLAAIQSNFQYVFRELHQLVVPIVEGEDLSLLYSAIIERNKRLTDFLLKNGYSPTRRVSLYSCSTSARISGLFPVWMPILESIVSRDHSQEARLLKRKNPTPRKVRCC